MNSDTQQFMYRVFISIFAIVILIMFGYMCVVGAVQGDGEAVRIIEALQPIAFGAFVSMAGVLGVHQITSASVAKATVNATSSSSSDATLAPQAEAQPQPQSAL